MVEGAGQEVVLGDDLVVKHRRDLEAVISSPDVPATAVRA